MRWLLITALLAALQGCGTLYVIQAANGEWHVMRARQPIDKVIADPRTPGTLRNTLTEVKSAREFASRELKLPDNRSYRTYVDVHRKYVVWNVVAAPELSVHPKQWCFPIAGCVAYRGYFAEKKARSFAAGLSERGFDVTLDGVPAYSTLGKFADPVLSTMIRYGPEELASIIFHELAHQLLYVKNDTQFNEAFATTVENAGLERWLTANGRAAEYQQFRKDSAREQQYVDLFARTRARLARLYASTTPVAEMREQKAKAFAELAQQIRDLEQQTGQPIPLYERWIQEGLNNARLASLANYYDCVPGFEKLLAEEGNDLPRFYAAARKLSRLPIAERHEKLCRSPDASPPLPVQLPPAQPSPVQEPPLQASPVQASPVQASPVQPPPVVRQPSSS
ncbi:MAG TPA: aminopeptidase [Steroidobacteraceae bacterium]|nr:aminopeptidase [Steroidobacteraceae bacterium]